MPHLYDLHQNHVLPCHCCFIPTTFRFQHSDDIQVCTACTKHGRKTDSERDHIHVTAWATYTQGLVAAQDAERMNLLSKALTAEQRRHQAAEAHAAEMERVRALILSRYHDEPTPEMVRWLQQGLVIEASANRETAYATRDAAMRHIWRIDQLHHTSNTDDTKCTCGNSTGKCKVWEDLEPFRGQLDGWVSRGLVRLRKGHQHGLPREHPEVRDHERRYGLTNRFGFRQIA